MSRLIDADALLTDRRMRMYYHLPNGDIAVPVIDIEHAPTIEERKTGEWIEVDDHYNRISGRCSVCGWEALLYETDVVGMDYCPNCGADMRGDNHE